MFGWIAWSTVALGSTWVAVVEPGDWTDPATERRLARKIGAEVTLIPATDLMQQGRAVGDVAPGAQPGRVPDDALKRIRREVGIAAKSKDCDRLLSLAEQVTFVDRESVRQARFAALVAAAECASAADLREPPWVEVVAGEEVSAPLSRAAALATLDPSLLAHVSGSVGDAIALLQQAPERIVVDLADETGGAGAGSPGSDDPRRAAAVEVRVDGVVVPITDDGIEIAGRSADVQLVRVVAGRARWGPSFRVTASSEPFRPLERAVRDVGAMVGALTVDGGAAFGGSVGAWTGLVNADALYLATFDRRRLTLWRWDPELGAFVAER